MWLCGMQCQLKTKPLVEPVAANLRVMVVLMTKHKEHGARGYLWPMTVPKSLEMEIHRLGALKHQLKVRSWN